MIYVKWRDSNQELYQREQTDILPVQEIETVGFELSEDDTSVTVARDLVGDDCRGMITIPKENIVERISLKERNDHHQTD